jgi:hypothetical protein
MRTVVFSVLAFGAFVASPALADPLKLTVSEMDAVVAGTQEGDPLGTSTVVPWIKTPDSCPGGAATCNAGREIISVAGNTDHTVDNIVLGKITSDTVKGVATSH